MSDLTDHSDQVLPTGPVCPVDQAPALVQWRRRSATDPEHTDAVYACGAHAIALDAAAHVHQASCTAPDPARLPGCDCTPEPLPPPEPIGTVTVTLPTGWAVPTT